MPVLNMISQKKQRRIIKYLDRQATILERNALEKWLENHNNCKVFKGYVKINYLIDLNMDLFDANDSKKGLLELIDRERKQFRWCKYVGVVKYAAIVIFCLGIAYFYRQGHFTNNNGVAIPAGKITLQLDNGNTEVLNEEGSKNIIDNQGNIVGVQNGFQLVYTNTVELEELVFNTLTVPNGKRFEVQLSDGTHVHLNAGSSLKYPVKFVKGKNREVFSKGLVYFDVTKDENHPFVVNTEKIGVRVLGTQFSLSSYPEDKDVSAVLVEGSVSIYNNSLAYNRNTASFLKPGFKADWNKKEGKLKIQETDIEVQMAWTNGKIVFRHVPFDDIIKKLERHYNVEIINNNRALGKDLISASFEMESIEEVFEVINEIHPIHYKIEFNKITIE